MREVNMALFYAEGINGSARILPFMSFEAMDLMLRPYVRKIVRGLHISDLDYSVWLYNKFTKKEEFLEGNLEIFLNEDSKTASFTVNNQDFYYFCVKDKTLKKRIQAQYDCKHRVSVEECLNAKV